MLMFYIMHTMQLLSYWKAIWLITGKIRDPYVQVWCFTKGATRVQTVSV